LRTNGTWTLSKWTGEDDVPEFYVNWSAGKKRGSIAEKRRQLPQGADPSRCRSPRSV